MIKSSEFNVHRDTHCHSICNIVCSPLCDRLDEWYTPLMTTIYDVWDENKMPFTANING